MMHMRDSYEGIVRLAVIASTCGQVSINATRCEMALVLSPEEAQALGFHSLGGGPGLGP